MARAGLYPHGIADDVRPERLERYFVREDEGYRVKSSLRDHVLFAVHDVLKDPPFSRLDLLSCRNLLIYLDSKLQAELLPIFHYAVKPGGLLFVSVYNDQGFESRVWRRVKHRYNRSGALGRRLLVLGSAAYIHRRLPLASLVRVVRGGGAALLRPPRARGMSARHDLVDWVGGYPFEVAKPEEVFGFLRERGFELRHLKTCAGGLGCNEYVFQRVRDVATR